MYKSFLLRLFIYLSLSHQASFLGAQVFVSNSGQLMDQYGQPSSAVLYYASFRNFRVLLTSTGFSYELLSRHTENTPGESRLHTEFNRIDVSFLNNCFTGEIDADSTKIFERHYRGTQSFVAYHFKRIIYKNIYEKIDVVFYTNAQGFKYDFVLHPGADLNNIRLHFESPFPTELQHGSIIIETPLGRIEENIPHSYFKESGQAADIQYINLESYWQKNVFGFSAKYKPGTFGGTLVIDPMPNVWFATYISGSQDEFPENVTIDPEGDIYVTGYTNSVNNIATAGSFQGSFTSFYDVFLVKYRPDGTKMWGTYMGGNSFDRAYGLTYKNGFIYLCGNTFSQNYATPGVHQTVNMNGDDAFLAKFDLNGNRIWCTYYGGQAHDFAASVIVNSQDEIYITGHTLSYTNIATSGVHSESFFGVSAAFLAKFSGQGQLIWGSYYGSAFEEGYGLALDSDENIVFSGFASSSNTMASPGAQQPTNAGGFDAFLAKFTSTGQRLWGTYLGGPQDDKGYDVCIDASDNIYVVGNTSSLTGIASGTGFQQQAGSIDDGFVAKYTGNGQRLWSTYIGGSEAEYLSAVGLYFDQSVIIAGKSQSTSQIATSGALSPNLAGQYDALLMKISPNGARSWGTYYGGTANDEFTGLALDLTNGFIHTSGMTLSNQGIATPGADQTNPNGGLFNGFLARFCAPHIPQLTTEIQAISCGNTNFSIDIENALAFSNFNWHDGSDTPFYNFTNLAEGQYFYTLSTVDTNNCTFVIDTVFFQVLPDVQIDVEILANQNPPYCQGSSATFFTPENYAAYAWYNGTTDEILNLNLQQSGLQFVALTVTDSNGCVATDSIFFEVLPAPQPEVQWSGSTNFCLGETAVASVSSPYAAYLWHNGATTPEITLDTDSWIWVSATNDFGCTGISDSVLLSSTNLQPEITLNQPPPICPNVSLTFEVANTFNSYLWSTGSTLSSTQLITASGAQWIAVQVGNLCGGFGTDTLYFDVTQTQEFNIQALVPGVLCIGSLVVAEVPGSFSNILWQNNLPGNIFDLEASQFGPWTITVQASDINGCQVFDTLELYVDSCVLWLNEHTAELIIFPNPTLDLLTIHSPGYQMGVIELFDAQGRIVDAVEMNSHYGVLNLTLLTCGLYSLKIFDESGAFREVCRIIKHEN